MLGLVSQIKIACDIENEVDSKFIMILILKCSQQWSSVKPNPSIIVNHYF